mmetsp:Transcript_15904/g.31911  ORF Transcript_15904/g.31911 Transcript_15904/m.31911 type:complete len:88 (-) Transcript_15904:1891-2154(-)
MPDSQVHTTHSPNLNHPPTHSHVTIKLDRASQTQFKPTKFKNKKQNKTKTKNGPLDLGGAVTSEIDLALSHDSWPESWRPPEGCWPF